MHNQLVNDMVNGAVSGWGGIESLMQSDAQKDRQRQEMLAIAQLYRETFSTESGRKVLAILLSQTVLQPTVTADATQFGAGIREGRADIVRSIMKQIEIANTGGQETLQPWQTLTPPQTEPAPKQRKPRKPASSTE